ncbi:MAG TPA: 4Fe-4S dicluster domain-containing protein [Dehalococcoidia bacterium]|nr:4Fe-4S dicluster domain-containing protein [Dehalococcoidia bacterium]
MIFAGIDIGSRAAKAVIMNDGEIIGSTIQDTGPESVKTAYATIEAAMQEPGITLNDIDYTVATGYGRVLVPFAAENVSEISCHARGINRYYPSVRTILDMGGQDCKAINCNEEGHVTNFVMNDKCAGGTGRFLEMIADVLNVQLEEIGELALTSFSEIPFNTICAVFAKSEAIVHLRHGVPKSDILAGLNEAISVRCHNLLKKVTIESDFTITGGIAKNTGMVDKITKKIGLEPLLAEDPQLIGALGAAIYAREKYLGKETGSDTRVQYGYNDATGDYYITINSVKCDGCGECITACPSSIYEIASDENGRSVAMVKETLRKKLSILCPGVGNCNGREKGNCQAVCPGQALTISW